MIKFIKELYQFIKFDLKNLRSVTFMVIFNLIPNFVSLKFLKSIILKLAGVKCGLFSNYIKSPCIIEFSRHLFIGNGVFINSNSYIDANAKVYIGNQCQIGPNLSIQTVNHSLPDWKENHLQVYIGNNVWIGANVTILPGSEIQDNTIVGAGSIVRGKIGNGLFVGQPAIFKKYL
jgi:acetyltransferase-like isoleucine patch superfamily enzyme